MEYNDPSDVTQPTNERISGTVWADIWEHPPFNSTIAEKKAFQKTKIDKLCDRIIKILSDEDKTEVNGSQTLSSIEFFLKAEEMAQRIRIERSTFDVREAIYELLDRDLIELTLYRQVRLKK